MRGDNEVRFGVLVDESGRSLEVVVGHLSTGHLSISSVKRTKVAIKIVMISSYFGKMMNGNFFFFFFLLIKSFF